MIASTISGTQIQCSNLLVGSEWLRPYSSNQSATLRMRRFLCGADSGKATRPLVTGATARDPKGLCLKSTLTHGNCYWPAVVEEELHDIEPPSHTNSGRRHRCRHAAGGLLHHGPLYGERQVSKTTKGAGIGAAVGAVAGILTGDDSRERRKRALIGAGVGALAGGAVGNYMDRQEAKLRQQLQGTGVSVTRNGNNITLNMPGNITFKTDSADLRPDFFDVLNSVSMVLKEYDKTILEVAGHTDSTGSDQSQPALSRASCVNRGAVPREPAA